MKTFTFKGWRGGETTYLLSEIIGVLENSGVDTTSVKSYVRIKGQIMLEDCAEEYQDIKKRWEQALKH